MVRIAPTLLRILFQFSLINLCAQDWVFCNPKGLTDEFATYWNGLTPEEVMVGCILSSLIISQESMIFYKWENMVKGNQNLSKSLEEGSNDTQ